MDKKYLYAGVGTVVVLLIFFTIPKYFAEDVTASGAPISEDIEKIEIIHFHGTNQCYSCVTMGDMAEETVRTYFADELESGKITFDHINAQLPENNATTKRYGATGSSLWIGTYYEDATFTKEENVNVWYKINNKTDYMDFLKGVIETKLAGE